MRLANHGGRAVLVLDDGSSGADVHAASSGAFGPDLTGIYDRWEAFVAWAAGVRPVADVVLDKAALGAPSPRPSQVVAIGLNYAAHATETGFGPPTDLPPVFTKFPSSITGPYDEVELPVDGSTDWEVEVVAVIGKPAHRVSEAAAWDHVAGLTIGQDLSERKLQFVGQAPQFGFASPTRSSPRWARGSSPWTSWPSEASTATLSSSAARSTARPCRRGRTADLIFSIPRTIAQLSEVITLRPGDVIFTGTPDGVGLGMEPPRFLEPRETLISWVEGIGAMEHTFR